MRQLYRLGCQLVTELLLLDLLSSITLLVLLYLTSSDAQTSCMTSSLAAQTIPSTPNIFYFHDNFSTVSDMLIGLCSLLNSFLTHLLLFFIISFPVLYCFVLISKNNSPKLSTSYYSLSFLGFNPSLCLFIRFFFSTLQSVSFLLAGFNSVLVLLYSSGICLYSAPSLSLMILMHSSTGLVSATTTSSTISSLLSFVALPVSSFLFLIMCLHTTQIWNDKAQLLCRS